MNRIAVLASAALLCSSQVLANERARLSGWGPFKFGQTISEAAKAAGPRAKVYVQAVEFTADLDGHTYTVSAAALGPSGNVINIIQLNAELGNDVTPEKCEARFSPMVKMISIRYGKPDVPSKPYASDSSEHVGKQAIWNFKDKGQIELTNAFSKEKFDPMKPWNRPCMASIEFQPGRDPDSPEKMKF